MIDTSELEPYLSEYAGTVGVSTAKLRCIYFRGVAECSDNAYVGSPVLYGLARVQRFGNAMQSSDPSLTIDGDMLPNTPKSTTGEDSSLTVSSSNQFSLLLANALYSSGELIRKTFEPGVTEAFTIEDNKQLTVLGTIDNAKWKYTLDINTGQTEFNFM